MITDLFSHKIHSSSPEWQDKLIELACVFAEFDGQVYDRVKIENRLQNISPRATFVARDSSKFRDEISAYPSYLGLYRIERHQNQWIFRLSETAKRYLTNEEPDVCAFMLLQLTLFQYPNGMGISYASYSDKLRIQANTRQRTFDFIRQNIHLSPLRLICKALEADSIIKNCSVLEASVTGREIYTLANQPQINTKALPNLDDVVKALQEIRKGLLVFSHHIENRFHILNHTDFLCVEKNKICLRETVNDQDRQDILQKFTEIINLSVQFNGFDTVKTENDFLEIMRQGNYGKYFDSLLSLSAETISILTKDSLFSVPQIQLPSEESVELSQVTPSVPLTYKLKERTKNIVVTKKISRKIQFADPEITKIKRQRSNLSHKLILQELDEYLRTLGANPLENEHIDLFAQIPNDGKYLFEVKSLSIDDNLLSQTRKGLSQLYEYRFRYQEDIGYDVVLCLVYSKEPKEIAWLQKYLCLDREIAIIWFENGQLKYSQYCRNLIEPLIV